MAKDDYDVIVFKILVYLYAVAKHKILFEKNTFYNAIKIDDIGEEYLNFILGSMKHDELIDGITFARAWGNELVLASDLENMYITSDGIHYLKENDRMNKIKNFLINNIEFISTLVTKVL